MLCKHSRMTRNRSTLCHCLRNAFSNGRFAASNEINYCRVNDWARLEIGRWRALLGESWTDDGSYKENASMKMPNGGYWSVHSANTRQRLSLRNCACREERATELTNEALIISPKRRRRCGWCHLRLFLPNTGCYLDQNKRPHNNRPTSKDRWLRERR